MQTIKLKRGLDIPFEGAAAQTIGSVRRPEIFHIVPDHFAGITPKLMVKEGETVKAGSPLFHDKAFEDMLFTSPVSGTVKAIVRGDRRKVMSIDIEADATIQYEKFDTKEEPKALLLKSGLWALIKQRPYDCIALPNKQPRAIFISSFDSAPVAPDYEWVLKGQLPTLQAGVSAERTIVHLYGIDAIYHPVCIARSIFRLPGEHLSEIFAADGEPDFRRLEKELLEKTAGNAAEVKSRGAYLMGVTAYGNYDVEDLADFCVYVPKTDRHFMASLAVVPLQLLAYYVSVAKGLDVDKPRNLAKSVTVE